MLHNCFAIKVLCMAISVSMTYGMRANLVVLYARTFDDNYYNSTAIALIVYGNYFMSGIMSLLFGIIGDKYIWF